MEKELVDLEMQSNTELFAGAINNLVMQVVSNANDYQGNITSIKKMTDLFGETCDSNEHSFRFDDEKLEIKLDFSWLEETEGRGKRASNHDRISYDYLCSLCAMRGIALYQDRRVEKTERKACFRHIDILTISVPRDKTKRKIKCN